MAVRRRWTTCWRPTWYPDGTAMAVLLCDVCGHNFDPLVCRWVCPHCGATWPVLPAVGRAALHDRT